MSTRAPRARRSRGTPAARRSAVGLVDGADVPRRSGITAVPLMQAFINTLPGGFTGARSDLREFSQWNVVDTGPHGDVLGDLEDLRARSRDLERNEPLGGGAIQTMVDGVVGRGLEPKPRIDRELLGLAPEVAAAWERDAARLWWLFAGRIGCDIGARHTFASLTDQVFREVLSGGDVAVLRRYEPQPLDAFGLKLQVMEAARVSTPDGMVETEFLRAGVKLDRSGKALSLFVADQYPNERYQNGRATQWAEVPMRTARGEPLCLHVFRQTRPEQVRGVPYLAPVILHLKQLARYSNSELMAAVISSMFTVFVKNAMGSEGLADIDPDDPNPVPPTQYKIGHGATVDLAEGEDVTFANPMRPNAQFDPFVQAIVRQIGVALGIPFEVLIKHFTASYSAARAALIQAWQTFLTRRSWLVSSFCQPVYEWVLDEAIARGLLVAPGWRDNALIRQAWGRAEWTGPVMPSINPVHDAVAAEKRINLRLSNRQRETAEYSGEDWDETFEQARYEEERLREAGMTSEAVAERVRVEPVEPERADDPADEGDEGDEGDDREDTRGRPPADEEALAHA